MVSATIISFIALVVLIDEFAKKSIGAPPDIPYVRTETCGRPLPAGKYPTHRSVISLRDMDGHYGTAVLIRSKEDQDETNIALTSYQNCQIFRLGQVGPNGINTPHTAYVKEIFAGIPARDQNRHLLAHHSINPANRWDMIPVRDCVPITIKKPGFAVHEHDIAIVILGAKIRIDDDLQIPCLPEPGQRIKDNDQGIVVGYGTPHEMTSTLVPKEIPVYAVHPKECRRVYRSLSSGSSADIGCVKEQQQTRAEYGFSRGDVGGAFLRQDTATQQGDGGDVYDVLLGIVIEAHPGKPVMITRVTPYVEDGSLHALIEQINLTNP